MSITTALAIAGAVGSLLSTLKGTRDASRQNKKSEQLLQKNLTRAEAEHSAREKNYLDTLEGKAIVTQTAETLRNVIKAINSNAIKTGQTTEQQLAIQGSYQDTFNKIMQNLAGKSTTYKQYYDTLLQTARDKYTNGQISFNTQKTISDVNSGNNMAQAIGNLTTAGINYYNQKQTTAGGLSKNSTNPHKKYGMKDFNVTQKDIDRANDMYLGNDYLRKYLQYR